MIPFLLGIMVGFILVYMYKEEKTIIMDYPKPYDTKVYTDKNGMQYQYDTKEVKCDDHEKNLILYPIQ
jgi:hypothetical protein